MFGSIEQDAELKPDPQDGDQFRINPQVTDTMYK